jgi:penicillin-binding protein 1A
MRSLSLIRLLAVVVVAGIAFAGITVAALPAIGEIVTAHHSTSSLPELRPLAQRSQMFASDGALIGEFKANENREPISFDQMPIVMRQSILAIEDAGFYNHDGVNIKALMRATLANVSAGGVRQGGSTITQQLVKNALVGDERNIDRKVAEAMYAMRLEEEMTKDQILERYLNTVYFGSGAYGVEAAAETFFGKSAIDLNLGEAAFLAGLVRAPGTYDPFRNPERSLARRNLVLDSVLAEGWATEVEVEAAKLQPIPTEVLAAPDAPPPVDYFVAAARSAFLNDPIYDDVFGDTYEERYDLLFRGGLTIETTFNPNLQAAAEDAVLTTIPADKQGQFTASIVALDPRTGAVSAMVGGPGFDRFQYNIATQQPGRQAGSSFKTFVLAAAVESGATGRDLVDGTAPCTFKVPGQADYTSRGGGAGVGTLESMTGRSINCAYLRLGQSVSGAHVVDVARRLGIESPELERSKDNITLAIGEVEVNPLEMASAYGTIANSGWRHDPYLIQRVVGPDGTVIYEHETGPGELVMDAGVAATITDILRSPIENGTASRNGRVEGHTVAGKTGTNDRYTDAWFVGYTPSLSVSVWMGSPLLQEPMRGFPGVGNVTGGSHPTQMWNKVMTAALAGQADQGLPEPPPPPNRRVGTIFNAATECAYRPVAGTAPAPADPNNPSAPPVVQDVISYQKITTPTTTTLPGQAPSAFPPLNFAPQGSLIAPCDRPPRPRVVATTTTAPAAPTTAPGTPASAPPTTPPTTRP